MKYQIDADLASRVLDVVDAGLVCGLGSPVRGQMCVEAAVCFAMGLPHSDQPPCVDSAVRAIKIGLNDANWSTNAARAKGMRRLAVGQLGTVDWDLATTVEFAKQVSVLAIRYANHALDVAKSATYATYAADAAAKSAYAADAAAKSASAAYASAAYAADAATYAAYAAAYAAAYVADAATYAAYAAYDKVLSDFAEEVVQILIQLKAPGTQFLPPII